MKTKLSSSKVNAIGNGIALILGLAFLGDLLELWSFDLFSGWWVLFLYIPAICGFLTKGVTSDGVMLILTAVVLTIGMVTDIDGRIWSCALIIYLAYIGGRSIFNGWNEAKENKQTSGKEVER